MTPYLARISNKLILTRNHLQRSNTGIIKDLERTRIVHRTNKMPYQTGSSISLHDQSQLTPNFFLRQMFDRNSCTFTYILADVTSKECVVIDPVIDHIDRDANIIRSLSLAPSYLLNTHIHADHITGTGQLKKLFPWSKTAISLASGAIADVLIKEGDRICFGSHSLNVLETPGHTKGCVTFVSSAQSCVFTGDTLLIRGCGRTDFQEGDSSTLYESIWKKIFTLPDNFKVYPAHDYNGQTESSILEEKMLNPRLSRPKEEFLNIMENLDLDHPKLIALAVPLNKKCGVGELPKSSGPFLEGG